MNTPEILPLLQQILKEIQELKSRFDTKPFAPPDLTVSEAAILLHCSGSKVNRLFHSGELTGYKVGDKIVIASQSIIDYKTRQSNANLPHFKKTKAKPGPKEYRHLDLR